MIKYLDENPIISTKVKFLDLLSLIGTNTPHIIIDDFTQVVQDISRNGTYLTKVLDRSKNRNIKVYKLDTGYSILSLSNCSRFLIASTDLIDDVCIFLSKELATKRTKSLSIRYGIRSDKILSIGFYNDENKLIRTITGMYFSKSYIPQIGMGKFGKRELYEDNFFEEVHHYKDYISNSELPIKPLLGIEDTLSILADKLTMTSGKSYGVISTMMSIISKNYKSKLSKDQFISTLDMYADPNCIKSKKDLIRIFKMEVTNV